MWLTCVFLVFLSVTIENSKCEDQSSMKTTTSDLYRNQLSLIENSIKLQKNLTKSIAEDFYKNTVTILTDFRVQVAFHKSNIFTPNDNEKWVECMKEKEDAIRNVDDAYYDNETKCLRDNNLQLNRKRKNLKLLIKEMKSWRRSFRYLMKLCVDNYPEDDESASSCLKKYMEEHKFEQLIAPLIFQLEQLSLELLRYSEDSLEVMKTCLGQFYSNYLDELRHLVKRLHRCYKISENELRDAPMEPFDFSKVTCDSRCNNNKN